MIELPTPPAKLVAPSILSANFVCLKEEIQSVVKAGADWIHIDVMDGHFVPNITIGVPVVRSIRPITNAPLDVHLMIENPGQYVEAFAKAGADIITVHAEACTHLHRVVAQIKDAGARAGVSLNPATSLDALTYVLEDLDLILIMSVNPGFGGQSFIPTTLPKLSSLAKLQKERGTSVLVEVDGGVKPNNAAVVRQAGADALVAGSAIFKAPSYQEVIGVLSAA